MLKILNRPKVEREPTPLNSLIEQNSSEIINFFGYIILTFTLLDYIALVIPIKLLNSAWELQIIGRFIETSWAWLLGLICIFYRRRGDFVKPRELGILLWLSRLTLLVAIAYFLMFPLLITNCIRISQNNYNQANQQLTLQSKQLEQLETKMNQATEADLEKLIATFPDRNAKLNLSPQQFREKVLTENRNQEQVAKKQIKNSLHQQQRELYKTTVKWCIGAILTGASAFFIWKSTKWSRVLRIEEDG
jgi:type II secretory pathway component PulM